MKQLTQKLKNGEMNIIDVPSPLMNSKSILVRNYYSLISPGTESETVKAARKSLLGKAKERPQQVKQVLDVLKTQGITQTLRTVNKKLDSLSPLGYSCAGEVIGVGEDVAGIKVGDYVACGGNSANHSEVVSVPENLCVRLLTNESSDLDSRLRLAAYNTLGAIAMQGVRQADVRLGETCGVIGLGLLGQLTCQLLKASGVRTIGIDIDEAVVAMTTKNDVADISLLMGDSTINAEIQSFAGEMGADAVIITAASSDTGPINFAGEIVRKRGKVVVVGDVPTGFDREPNYYRKEVELRMSCSYGPGRYDSNYEEKGLDYPPAYVRWTENRNMQAFQELIRSGTIDISYLTTHEFNLEDAAKAYEKILSKRESCFGILLKYNVEKDLETELVNVGKFQAVSRINLAFIGAGNYAQGSLLPNLPKNNNKITRKIIFTATGTTSRSASEKFGFESCTSDPDDIFNNDDINTVFISTRHDSHAQYVVQAINSGKNIFVEKPLCITRDDLRNIEDIYQNKNNISSNFMVGYNRRFSPFGLELNKYFNKKQPMSMLYRINAGEITADHWIKDHASGGGRVIGEVCHFIDYMVYLCGSLVTRIYASGLPDTDSHQDSVIINLEFENGSVGSISYYTNGAKSLFKEYVEVSSSGITATIKDFKKLEIYNTKKLIYKKSLGQNKGQENMLKEFFSTIERGVMAPISPSEIFNVSRTTFSIIDSLRTKAVIEI